MWFKFDGEKAYVQLEGEKFPTELASFTIDAWVEFIEREGKLYVNGIEITPEAR